jgi:hypothetical protein
MASSLVSVIVIFFIEPGIDSHENLRLVGAPSWIIDEKAGRQVLSIKARSCIPELRPARKGKYPKKNNVDNWNEHENAPPSAIACFLYYFHDGNYIQRQNPKDDDPMNDRHAAH